MAEEQPQAAEDGYDTPTNHLKPLSDATLTIRVIKSFVFRTTKPCVLHHVDLEQVSVGELKGRVSEMAKPAWKAYKNVTLDTLKIYTVAHGHKTTNLIINLEDDPALILSDDNQTLAKYGLENETELSLYSKADYDAYVQNPETKW